MVVLSTLVSRASRRAYRCSLVQSLRGWLVVLLSCAALAACGSGPAPEQVLASRCLPIGSPQGVALDVVAPETGTLRIGIEGRGLSIVAALDGDPHTLSASPVERFGVIALVSRSERGQHHSVRVRAEDSPDIQGEVCVDAHLIASSDHARVQAEQSFAAAGQAVQKKDWNAAFAHYLRAARRFDHLNRPRSAGAARQAMAELAYLRLDRKRDSYALASEALADYGTQRGPILTGLLLGLQGKALVDTPGIDVRTVAPRVRELFQAARRYDSTSRFGLRELPRLDIMTGFLEYRLDEQARAQQTFAEVVQSCRTMQDWDCYAIASQNLAQFASESKGYSTALSLYADALRRLPPQLDPKLAADIWNNFGHLQGVVGLYSSSEHSHATAMRLYAQLGDCPGVRRSLSYLGNLMVQIGSLGDAEDYLHQAASRNCSGLLTAASAAASDSKTDTGAEAPIVHRYYGGSKAESRDQLCTQPLEAPTLATDNKMIVFNSLLSLGDALHLEGESTLAQHCINAAGHYAVTARSRMRLANARGTALLDNNDPAGARASFEHSLQIANDAGIPAKYEYRGSAQLGIVKATLLAGKATDTVSEGFRALIASMSRGDIDQTVTSLQLIAAGYQGSHRLAEASQTLQTAADLVEAVPIDELDGEKRATYLATQHTVFAALMDLSASQAATDPEMAWMAFATSERGRARSLRYAVSQATRDSSSPLEAPPAARYQQLLREVIQLPAADANGAGRKLIEELDTAARREREPAQIFDRVRLGRTLDQLGATLIEYAAGAHDLFAFIVTGSGAQVVRVGDRSEIAGAAGELRDRLRDPESPQSTVRAAAEHLARLVLWPLAGKLSARRLIIVPDDALHTIPFDVLPWSPEAGQQLVLNRAEVSTVASALFLTQLHSMSPARIAAPRIALIGDPVFRISDWRRECAQTNTGPQSAPSIRRNLTDWTESLPRLPGSRAEVQMVARLARQSRADTRVEMFLGCAAVPSALRRAAREGVDLLHIATHARVDAQRPRLSALALAPEPASNPAPSAFGLLDILGLKLNTSLVVLSACDTSRGRLLPGEGVLGPAQAFLQAGATAVLASYWRVDDQSTSQFMQQFYRYLLAEHLPAATALRKAQLDRAAASPSYDWAAFALYGWPDSRL